jgi:hypothetical protein
MGGVTFSMVATVGAWRGGATHHGVTFSKWPRHDSRNPAGAPGICGLLVPVDAGHRRARQRWNARGGAGTSYFTRQLFISFKSYILICRLSEWSGK